MSKLIALQSGTHDTISDAWINGFSNLKQKSLLFDQIGIFKLNRFYNVINESLALLQNIDTAISDKAESIITELEWLKQAGIIFELKIEEEFNYSIKDFSKKVSTETFEDTKYLFKKINEIQTVNLVNSKNDAEKAVLIREQHFALLRLMSIIMEITKEVTAVTTFPHTEYTHELPDSKKAMIALIVINKLPLPNNETPWEQIIDYRNDSENQKNLLSLRRWIRKISTENLPPAEIEEEIEWLTSEFQSHMKIHKIKANTEALEIIIKTPLETIENLLKLNFSKISDPLFAIKKRQISLMEAELNAPGREMAYIIKTRETFQSQE